MKIKKPITFIIFVALSVVLLNPQWLGLPATLLQEIQELTQKTFTFGGDTSGLLSRLFVVFLMFCLVGAVAMVLQFILSKISSSGNRQATISELLLNLLHYIVVIIIVIWALTILGVDVTAIIAGLGIMGLILGFGAQSLIEDMITGIFIIFEGQFNIGDIIILDDCRGTVKRIGVRTTTIEDAGGNLKIINNSDIRNVQNRSVNPSLATTICAIAYECDIRKVELIIEKELPLLIDKYPDLFLQAPYLLGVDELADSGVNLKFAVKCKEEDIFAATRALNREIKIIFDDHGIEIPFPQVVVHQGK